MTTLPPTNPGPIICAAREQRADGTHEYVRPPGHVNQGHYWVLLVRTGAA